MKLDMEKLKCSRAELHNFPDLKDNTKCRDCGVSIRDLRDENMRKMAEEMMADD